MADTLDRAATIGACPQALMASMRSEGGSQVLEYKIYAMIQKSVDIELLNEGRCQ